MVGRGGCLGRSSRLFEFPVFPTRFITRPSLSIGVASFRCPRYTYIYIYIFGRGDTNSTRFLGEKRRGGGGGNIVGVLCRVHPGIALFSPFDPALCHDRRLGLHHRCRVHTR